MKKDERTADLRTIFTEEKGHINVHTGEKEDGWWCSVCRFVLWKFVTVFSFSLCFLLGMWGYLINNAFLRGAFQHAALTLLGKLYLDCSSSC